MQTSKTGDRPDKVASAVEKKGERVSAHILLCDFHHSGLEAEVDSVVEKLNEALDSLERAKVVGQEALEFEVSI